MIATPAWPPRSTPRLFVPDTLSLGARVVLDADASHYVAHVMRLGEGAPLLLCDDDTGEWRATIEEVRKKAVSLTVEEQLRPREPVPDLWLLVAPVRRARFEWLVEKATELGVDRIVPVLTRRSVVDRVKPERLAAIAREAAEQCARTALPQIADARPLEDALDDWPSSRALYFADETGGAPALTAFAAGPASAAILIGPEGGFDPAERAQILAHPAAIGIGLGPRILRAETAAIAAATLWTAVDDARD